MDVEAEPRRPGGEGIPAFMEVVVGRDSPAGQRALAERNLLKLDAAMQAAHAGSLGRYRATLRAAHPIVLALFTEGGGELTLYPPGAAAVTAPAPPLAYQLVKSVAHSAMASFQLTAPTCASPSPSPSPSPPPGAGRSRPTATWSRRPCRGWASWTWPSPTGRPWRRSSSTPSPTSTRRSPRAN
jgi:hypothetical protein